MKATQSVLPAAGEIAFELDRFELSADDRLELSGRWFGVRGRRFMRPSLTLLDGDAETRLLADLEHKPWAPEHGEPWEAAFPCTQGCGDTVEAELTVSPDLTIRLPSPASSRKRAKSGKRGQPRRPEREPARPTGEHSRPKRERPQPGRGQTRRARQPSPNPPADERALNAARAEIESLRERVGHITRELEDRRGTFEGELAEVRSEAAEALAARDSAVSERDAAIGEHERAVTERDRAVAERDSGAESLDRTRAERDAALLAREQALELRDAALHSHRLAVQARDQAIADRDSALETLEQPIADRNGALETLEQAIADRDRALHALDRALAQRDDAVERRDQALQARDSAIAERGRLAASAERLPLEPAPAVQPQRLPVEREARGPALAITATALLVVVLIAVLLFGLH